MIYILPLIFLLSSCATITQRHDFHVSKKDGSKVCKNALLLNPPHANYVIQSQSLSGLTLAGFFFAPIFPFGSARTKSNVIRVHSENEFSEKEKEDLNNWKIESEKETLKVSGLAFKAEKGHVGEFDYAHTAELTFVRPHYWGRDFKLLMSEDGRVMPLSFDGQMDWSYQWLGQEERDPICL